MVKETRLRQVFCDGCGTFLAAVLGEDDPNARRSSFEASALLSTGASFCLPRKDLCERCKSKEALRIAKGLAELGFEGEAFISFDRGARHDF